MDHRRVAPARRVVAAVSAAWIQAIAVLAPCWRRAVAAARSGCAQTVAFLAPRYRRAVAAIRSGWAQTVAFLAVYSRRAMAAARSGSAQTMAFLAACAERAGQVARTVRDRPRNAGHQAGEPRGGLHRRGRAADLRGRMSHLVKQRSEIERAEYVGLTDLLEDERDPQYQ